MKIFDKIPWLVHIVAIILAVCAAATMAQQAAEIRNIMAHGTFTPADARVNGYAEDVISSIDWTDERDEFIRETMNDGASRNAAEDAAEQMFGI